MISLGSKWSNNRHRWQKINKKALSLVDRWVGSFRKMEVTRFEKEAETDRKRDRGKWADVGWGNWGWEGAREGAMRFPRRLCLGEGVPEEVLDDAVG